MAIENARKDLAAALKPALPKFVIFPDPGTLKDTITKPTLVLERTRVEKLPASPLGFYKNSLTLFVIEPTTYPGKSEDSLDDLLEDVLNALDDQAKTAWTSADRAVYGANPAYAITLIANSTRKENN